MEEKGKLLCMLCCAKYKHGKKGNLGGLIRFKQFCRELECLLVEKKLSKQKRQKQRLKGELNLAYGDLSVCPECLNLICAAIETKSGTKELEEQVLGLQTQILELMAELDGRMGTFLTRMKRIESVVKGSDEQRLLAYLEENVTVQLRDDAVTFRQRIMEAVEDLRIYRKELTDKVSCENLLRRMRRKNVIDRKIQTDFCVETNNSTSKKNRLKLKHVAQQTDPIFILENGDEASPENSSTVKVEVDPGDYSMEDDDAFNFDDDSQQQDVSAHTTDLNEHEDGYSSNQEEGVTTKSGRPKRAATKRKRQPSPSLSFSSDSESEDDNDYKDDCDVSEAGSNFSEDNFEMLNEKTRSKKERVLFDNLDVSQMSEFKKKIVSNVLRRLECRMDSEGKIQPPCQEGNDETLNASVAATIEDPRENFLIQYNSENGKLTLENIEIICDDSSKSLKCSLCNYTVDDPNNNPVGRIHNHLVGKHLNGFQCGTCSLVLSNIQTYKDHIAGHKQLTVCKVCGKGFRNKYSLPTHMWLHMNEDEKADAIQRGMTNPKDLLKKRKMAPKKFSCSTCGKMFRTESEVRNHEIIHGERERIPCHACGKLLLANSYSINHHEKYSCPNGKQALQQRRECSVCHKSYKNNIILKKHMAIEHPPTPLEPVCCELCGRQYKTKNGLKKHMRETHSDERPFSCSVCGASFKNKNNCIRHEKTCKNGVARMGRRPPQNQTSGNSSTKMSMEALSRTEAPRVQESATAGSYVLHPENVPTTHYHPSQKTFKSEPFSFV